MTTTIRISNALLKELKLRKIHDKESCEEVIWDLLEDTMELSEETKRHIKQSQREIKEGKTISFEKLKKEIEA